MRFHHAILGLLAPFLASACDSSSVKTCAVSGDCLQGGVAGTCRPSPSSDDSFCSFPDPDCPAPPAERWGVLAGDGLAGTCVDMESGDAGTDAPPLDGDAGPPPESIFAVGGPGVEAASSFTSAVNSSIILAGSFFEPVDFGGGPLMSAGLEDAFVARFDMARKHEWSFRFGGSESDQAVSVVTAANGDVVFAGNVTGTIDFGGGPIDAPATSLFVVRYTSAGEHVWSRTYPIGSFTMSRVSDMAIDDNANVYVVGRFTGEASFGSTILRSMLFTDAFVAKLDGKNGDPLWARQFGGSARDAFTAVAVRGTDLAIGGTFQGSAMFGTTLTAKGDTDGVVMLADGTSGEPQWSRQIGGAMASSFLYDIAIDDVSSLYAVGEFSGAVDAGGGKLTSAGGQDGLVVRYNSNGAHAWSRRLGGGGDDLVAGVAVDTGGLTVVGKFEQGAEIAGSQLMSQGPSDAFIVRLTKANAPRAVHRFGGPEEDAAAAVLIASQTLVLGEFSGTATLDVGALPVSSKDGSKDIFVLGLNLP